MAVSLALARAKLTASATSVKLEHFEVLWRQLLKGKGGQEAAQVVFSPRTVYVPRGGRPPALHAQDPTQPEGKILCLMLDGKTALGNPNFGKIGEATIPLIDRQRYRSRQERDGGEHQYLPQS